MESFLQVGMIIISVLLVAVVLLQPKESGLSVALTGNSSTQFERRGPAKALHSMTIALGTLFIVLSLVLFLIG